MKTKIAKFGFVLLLVGLVLGNDLLFSHSGLMLFGDYCIFIELFGWFGVDKQPWDWRKAVGMAVAIAGIIIFKWK